MLKIIIFFLSFCHINNVFSMCMEANDRKYQDLAAFTYFQQENEVKNLLKTYCYSENPKNNWQYGYLVMLNSVKMLKILESNFNTNWIEKNADEQENDIFTSKLVMKEDTEFNLIDINQYLLKRKLTTEKIALKKEKIEQDFKELTNYLSKQYSKSIKIHTNKYGDFALIYVIAGNSQEYLIDSLGKDANPLVFMKKNNNGLNPLHMIFSPSLKNKEVKELNTKLIKLIPKNYYLNNDIEINSKKYSYFEFVETYKNNNKDFYNYLKKNYKFNVNKIKEIDSQKVDKNLNVMEFIKNVNEDI